MSESNYPVQTGKERKIYGAGVTSPCFVRLGKQIKESYEKSEFLLSGKLLSVPVAGKTRNWVK